LIIDKDFQLGAYGYKPLIFRPKTVFTQGYVVVDDKDMPQLINSKFYRYFELLKRKNELGYRLDKNTQVYYVGDLYRVNFKEIWENYFSKLSFSEFKRAFYEGSLQEFPNTDKYIPHYLLVVEWFVDSPTSMLNNLNQFFEVLYQSFDRLAKTNKYFSLSDFKKVVKDISKRNAIEFSKSVNLDNVLSKFYSIMNNFFKTHNGYLRIMGFKSESETYFVEKPTRLRNFFQNLLRRIYHDYSSATNSSKTFIINGRTQKGDLMIANPHFVGAQFLEMLGLAEYSIVSGERPEFFLRVNNIQAIKNIINNDDYKSPMVQTIARRHFEGVQIMKYFFENLESDTERWDFIEDYFNGRISLENL
jgi:ATP-dependent DNA helicase RecQ